MVLVLDVTKKEQLAFPHSHETKTPLSRSGRKRIPLTISGLKKNGSRMAPAATSFRAPSECHDFWRPG